MTGLGAALYEELYPPPPPAYKTSPVAFGEATSMKWRRLKHIEVMEQAILEALATPTGGRLIIAVSVRHGKSMFASRILPAWYLGNNPDKRVMLVGHEADFASRHSRAARDILTAYGPDMFGVKVSQASKAADRWDIEGREGGMLSLGINGSPIGRGADLLIADDLYRSYTDAMNPKVREKVEEAFVGTLMTRLEENGHIIIPMARWHVEDLMGRLVERSPDTWKVLRMPAICDDPENDPTGRAMGEPLWPGVWSIPVLEQRRLEVARDDGESVWDAQYQQEPQGADGTFFDRNKWVYVDELPQCRKWVRAWDLAATKDAGDWTVGVLLGVFGKGKDQRTVVADVVRGRWSADEVRKQLVLAARKDPKGTVIDLPQDPGSAGKDQVQQLVALLGKYGRVTKKPQSGSKEVRAAGVSSQQLAGNVCILKPITNRWVGPLIAETDGFNSATYDDQVDALSAAYNRLVGAGARLIA